MPVPPPPHAKQVYHGKRHAVWEWDQALYDGTHTTFSCIVREDTVAIIPFLDADTILLQQEEQPDRDAPFLDVPGGCVDPGELPEIAAKRELTEETQHTADTLQLFRTKKFSGMTRFEEHIFLAKQLTLHTGAAHSDAGERIVLKPTPWKEAVALSLQGALRRREAMLAILAMEFDPEARAIKEQFLK